MPFRRRALQGPDSSQTPRSAAWLAGERIFLAPPPQEEPATPVVVTVRRSKLGAQADEAADQRGAGAGSFGSKGPRVFRVDTTGSETAPEPAPVLVAPEPEPAPAKLPLRKRVGVDRRPGPVLQVFRAEPVVQEDAPPDEERPFNEQASALQAMLAEVTRIVADAQRAGSLRFVDER